MAAAGYSYFWQSVLFQSRSWQDLYMPENSVSLCTSAHIDIVFSVDVIDGGTAFPTNKSGIGEPLLPRH